MAIKRNKKGQFVKGSCQLFSKETRKKLSKNNGRYWLGKKHTKKTKEKISKAHKGQHHSPDTEFKKGDKMSEEIKKKMSEAHKGDKNVNWKGGITSENMRIRHSMEIRLWREAVFARDNWTCQKSGIRGCKLVAHHINNFFNFPELRTSIENGITFSVETHKEFHKKYGYKNNTKQQLIDFLK